MTNVNFQSFGDSVLHNLSSQSWRRGIANYFSESVPFSFSSGAEYADLAYEVIQLFLSRLNQSLNMVEFGAGSGRFSKKLIQKLTDTESRFHYLVTDIIDSMLNSIDTIPIISNASNVQTKQLDIQKFFLAQPFDVGILNYVLSTCPVTILELDNGILSEWKVDVNVNDDAEIIWVSGDERVVWNKSEIEQFLTQISTNPIPDNQLSLLSRIPQCLSVQWQSFPCDPKVLDSSGILERWLKKQPKDVHGFFNFSSSWWQVLDLIRKSTNNRFLMMICDFANSQGVGFNELTQTFRSHGVVYSHCVSYFLIKEYCELHSLQYIESSSENDCQIAVITSLKSHGFSEDVSLVLSQSNFGQKVEEFKASIYYSDSLESCLAHIRRAKQELTSDQQTDYYFLYTIARKLFDFHCYDQVILYCDYILFDYGGFSCDVILLKSQALQRNGMHQEALSLINKGIEWVPNFDLFYLEKARITQDLELFDDAKEALNLYFQYSLKEPRWELFKLIGP